MKTTPVESDYWQMVAGGVLDSDSALDLLLDLAEVIAERDGLLLTLEAAASGGTRAWQVAAEQEALVGKLLDERDALTAKLDLVRALHYSADNDSLRTATCAACQGKAGVHECGCWADEDRQPVCGHCNDRDHRGLAVSWPCPTMAILDADGDLS